MTTIAKDIMSTELIFAHPKMTIEEAIKTLVNNRITGLPVVDEGRHLIGVLSEYDIIKSISGLGETDEPIQLNQSISFNSEVFSITEETSLSEILNYFIEQRIRRLPVVNKKKQLIGIITRRDIMKVLFYRSRKL